MSTTIVSVFVPRKSEGETVFAIFSCTATDEVRSPGHVSPRVARAVTTWVTATEAGKEALAEAGGDYNIGDLVHDICDEELLDLLAEEGILSPEIELHSYEGQIVDWNYDTNLVRK